MLNRLSRDGSQELSVSRRLNGCPISPWFWEKWGFFSNPRTLLADAELADHSLVPLGIIFLEVVQQATPLADQHEKAAARGVVFLVRLEVLRQLANPFAEQSDLHFRAAGIARVGPVLVNEGFLLLSG